MEEKERPTKGERRERKRRKRRKMGVSGRSVRGFLNIIRKRSDDAKRK